MIKDKSKNNFKIIYCKTNSMGIAFRRIFVNLSVIIVLVVFFLLFTTKALSSLRNTKYNLLFIRFVSIDLSAIYNVRLS